jgi:hypothetical protein
MPLNTLADCQTFLENQRASVIASQLRKEQKICQQGDGLPSLLVHCLPPSTSQKGKEIAHALSIDEKQSPQEHIP